MADIQHAVITDPHIHEPKGIASAAAGTVYIASGTGSGTWRVVDLNALDTDALLTFIQDSLNSGDLDLNGRYWLTAVLPDVSTAGSVIVPILRNSTVVSASVVLGGSITDADANISFKNSAGASMGGVVTIPFTASAKGNQFAFTATGNNNLVGPTWIEVETDGASTGTASLAITLELSTVLNL